ncbi:MAG TPA: sugar phosphate nucleotidyltransferase [Armatimonadota bacterium]|nr:sugar phosphate nucleotidyltransferase [Armatimonadota bacterium]
MDRQAMRLSADTGRCVLKGVILAAGMGTRMRPLTYRRPKPLVPVLDRPMIEHIIDGAADAGVTELLVIIGYRADMIKETLGDGERFGLRIEYELQEKPAGTGDATLLAEDFIAGEPFFLSWGDIIVSRRNYARIGEIWRDEKPEMLLTLNVVDDPYEGAAVYVEDNRVVKIIEKPPKGTSTTNYNNAGIFIMPPEILPATKETGLSERGERELPEAIQLLLTRGARIRGVPIEGCWSDVARPAEVIQNNNALLTEGEIDGGAIHAATAITSEGVATHAPYILADGAAAEEGVIIGPGAHVLQGAKVGAGARIEHSLILAGATVGEGSVLEWAVVEEGHAVPEGTFAVGTPDNPAYLGCDES